MASLGSTSDRHVLRGGKLYPLVEKEKKHTRAHHMGERGTDRDVLVLRWSYSGRRTKDVTCSRQRAPNKIQGSIVQMYEDAYIATHEINLCCERVNSSIQFTHRRISRVDTSLSEGGGGCPFSMNARIRNPNTPEDYRYYRTICTLLSERITQTWR